MTRPPWYSGRKPNETGKPLQEPESQEAKPCEPSLKTCRGCRQASGRGVAILRQTIGLSWSCAKKVEQTDTLACSLTQGRSSRSLPFPALYSAVAPAHVPWLFSSTEGTKLLGAPLWCCGSLEKEPDVTVAGNSV